MKGFTLIETIIAILVIGIAFMGLASAITGVFTNAVYDEAVTTALMLARGEMERVLGLGFVDVADENRDSPAAFNGNFSSYLWQIRVDAVPVEIANDPAMASYKQIESRITNPIAGDISLKTIVTNY